MNPSKRYYSIVFPTNYCKINFLIKLNPSSQLLFDKAGGPLKIYKQIINFHRQIYINPEDFGKIRIRQLIFYANVQQKKCLRMTQ